MNIKYYITSSCFCHLNIPFWFKRNKVSLTIQVDGRIRWYLKNNQCQWAFCFFFPLVFHVRVAWKFKTQNFEVGVSTQSSIKNLLFLAKRLKKWILCARDYERILFLFLLLFSSLLALSWCQPPIAHLHWCGANASDSAGSWTLSFWLVELGKGIPACKEYKRNFHHFFLATSSRGWLQWHRTVWQYGGGGGVCVVGVKV